METQTVSAADLAADNLSGQKPATSTPPQTAAAAPTPAAAPAATTAEAPAPAVTGVPGKTPDIDSLGRPFDPAKFSPKKDSKGRWVNKNAGRKPSTPAAASSSGKSYVAPDATAAVNATGQPLPDGSGTAATAPGAVSADRFDLAAEMYSRAGYSILDGVFAGNGEWLPESDAEHVALRGALATYLRHKNTDDLPPGLALSLALATYGARRFSKPNTLTRLRMISYWVRSKIWAWRTGRALDNLPPPTPPAPASEQRPLPPQNLPPADSSTAPKL